jgi:hypothetical protein
MFTSVCGRYVLLGLRTTLLILANLSGRSLIFPQQLLAFEKAHRLQLKECLPS